MTAPTVTPNKFTIDKEERDRIIAECEAIWAETQRQQQQRRAVRLLAPIVRLWDGDWKICGLVHGYLTLEFGWKMNNTGTANMRLPLDHHIAKWVIDPYGRPNRNIHMTVDKDGARWGGRMKNFSIVKASDGHRYLDIEFLDDYEELKYYNVWSNPFTPAGFQFPKLFILAGPARYMLKLALFVNILRQQSSLWHLPSDPLDPASWAQGLTPWNWSKVVQPGSFLLDDSQWCIMHSRFKTWHDMAKPILQDAGLMVVTRRWLKGDPDPWPGAIMRNGQLIIDIVDKSGVFEQTALGGTVFGGMWRTVTKFGDNFVDEIVENVANPHVPVEYSLSKWLGTAPAQPWVVYHDGDISGIETSEYTMAPATAVQFNGGGKSAPGVNEAIETGIKLIGDLISSLFVGATGLGNIANTALQPLYKDVILAFYSFKHVLRAMQLGWDHYFEVFITNGGTGYTLSSIMAIRAAVWETKQRESLKADIADGAPYLVGDRGQGHFFLGDRIGIAPKGLPGGRVVVEQVTELSYSASREKTGWAVSLGDTEEKESPWDKSLRQIQDVFGMLHELQVM